MTLGLIELRRIYLQVTIAPITVWLTLLCFVIGFAKTWNLNSRLRIYMTSDLLQLQMQVKLFAGSPCYLNWVQSLVWLKPLLLLVLLLQSEILSLLLLHLLWNNSILDFIVNHLRLLGDSRLHVSPSDQLHYSNYSKTAPMGAWEVKLPALLQQYDRPTDQPTNQPTDQPTKCSEDYIALSKSTGITDERTNVKDRRKSNLR